MLFRCREPVQSHAGATKIEQRYCSGLKGQTIVTQGFRLASAYTS
jgi:hypothetical protein